MAWKENASLSAGRSDSPYPSMMPSARTHYPFGGIAAAIFILAAGCTSPLNGDDDSRHSDALGACHVTPDSPAQAPLAERIDWILCDGGSFRFRSVLDGAATHIENLEARLQMAGYNTASWYYTEEDVIAGPDEAYAEPVDEDDVRGMRTGVLHAYLPDQQGKRALMTNVNSLDSSPRDPMDQDAPNVGASLSASGEAVILTILEHQSLSEPLWTDAFFFSGELGHHGWAVLSYGPWLEQHGDIISMPGWDVVASLQNVGTCLTPIRPNWYVAFHAASRAAYDIVASSMESMSIDVVREHTPTRGRSYDEWGAVREAASSSQSFAISTYGDAAPPYVHLASPWWHEPHIEGTLDDVPSALCWPRLEAMADLLMDRDTWDAAAAAAASG